MRRLRETSVEKHLSSLSIGSISSMKGYQNKRMTAGLMILFEQALLTKPIQSILPDELRSDQTKGRLALPLLSVRDPMAIVLAAVCFRTFTQHVFCVIDYALHSSSSFSIRQRHVEVSYKTHFYGSQWEYAP